MPYAAAAIIALVMISSLVARFYRLHKRLLPMARVEPYAVYLTAGGHLLDVRYRVVQPGRSLAPDEEIYLVSPDGRRMEEKINVAKIGRLAGRRSDVRIGGYLLLRNRGQVGRGDRVGVVIGQNRLEGLVVI